MSERVEVRRPERGLGDGGFPGEGGRMRMADRRLVCRGPYRQRDAQNQKYEDQRAERVLLQNPDEVLNIGKL